MIASPIATAASDKDKLPQRYQEWLNRDVAYIITNEERDAFKLLSTDAERDNFIERFWELRNPTPGAPDNPFRTEHYRRLAYASDHFGSRSARDGWRTDQGRIYITLGEPKQKGVYNGFADIRPMEIWFYSSVHPALPPFFNIVFYQREHGDEMRLYSPYADGPAKLVTTLDGNNRRSAFRLIDQHAGREVARTTLSLIPSEPVDMEQATSSLQSDVVLAAIRNLANHPLTRQILANKRELLESVTHRVVLPGEFLNVLAVGLRDSRGETFLHYALGVQRPDEFSVGTASDGRHYYSIEVRAAVHDDKGKLIFSQVKAFSRYLEQAEFERVKGKVFGFEGMLPLPAGKYKVDFQLTDKLKRTALRAEKNVIIASPTPGKIAVSEIVPFDQAEAVRPIDADLLPFAAANVKFTPLMGRDVDTIVGGKLKFFYQLWAPARDPAAYGESQLKVQHAYGRPGGPGGDKKIIVDEVRKSQFDAAGSLVNGKSLDLEGAPPGNYVLAISVTDAGDQAPRTHVTLPFRVVLSKNARPSWHIYDNTLRNEQQAGTLQYQRALAYLAFADKPTAERWFQLALERDPSHHLALAQLSTLLYERSDFPRLAALFQKIRITEKTDDETIIRLADSLDRTGQRQRCIDVLEQALKTHPESGTMYLALASLYRKQGDTQRAEELEKKGRQLVISSSM